jgi:hypothetical protein
MGYSDQFFDFESILDFSGMFMRKPFYNEVLFTAVLETIMLLEDVSPTNLGKAEIIKDKHLNKKQQSFITK